jgi:hypothetical protein
VAGRFKILTDEHWSRAHRRAAGEAGWQVVRAIDVLAQGTQDSVVLAYCAEHNCAWVTSDEAARGHVVEWLSSGRTLPGVIIVPQRYRITPGRFVEFLERLAADQNPFPAVVRYFRP